MAMKEMSFNHYYVMSDHVEDVDIKEVSLKTEEDWHFLGQECACLCVLASLCFYISTL